MHTEIAVTVMLSESGMDGLRQAMASDKTGDATPAFADAPGSGSAMPPPDTSSVTPRKKTETFSFPAVWFGDFRQADIGSFGSQKKSKHFAVVLPPDDLLRRREGLRFSIKQHLVAIPAGLDVVEAL